MILSANGRDYTIPGKNLKVTVSSNLARKDLSGQTASTDTANEGNKAKKISCALLVEMKYPEQLETLQSVSEAVTSSGDPEVYTLSHLLCNTMKIRQVIFSDTFEAVECEDLRAWNVKFNLKEYNSVPEKKEKREVAAQIKGTDSSGKEIKPSSNDSVLTQVIKTSGETIKS